MGSEASGEAREWDWPPRRRASRPHRPDVTAERISTRGPRWSVAPGRARAYRFTPGPLRALARLIGIAACAACGGGIVFAAWIIWLIVSA